MDFTCFFVALKRFYRVLQADLNSLVDLVAFFLLHSHKGTSHPVSCTDGLIEQNDKKQEEKMRQHRLFLHDLVKILSCFYLIQSNSSRPALILWPISCMIWMVKSFRTLPCKNEVIIIRNFVYSPFSSFYHLFLPLLFSWVIRSPSKHTRLKACEFIQTRKIASHKFLKPIKLRVW